MAIAADEVVMTSLLAVTAISIRFAEGKGSMLKLTCEREPFFSYA
jgi:hypothetical protein